MSKTMLKKIDIIDSEIKYPEFENNKVSTKTIIAHTNLSFNIDYLFENLPITPYVFVPKKRGRKKKSEVPKPEQKLLDGSIITLKNANKIRGVETKRKKKQTRRSKTYFRNSLTVVMMIMNKKLNFKLSKNGKFQITGCKTDEQAELCVKNLWNMIKKNEKMYKLNEKKLEVMFAPAMRNIDFDLGFFIDREKLSRYINDNTEYYSMLEASFGYTGVNIKFPMTEDITKLVIKKLIYNKDVWEEHSATYGDYLNTYNEKERNKKQNKRRYTTFLLFHSGRAIESGLHEEYMRGPYNKFIDIIKKARPVIEEKLDSSESDSDSESEIDSANIHKF